MNALRGILKGYSLAHAPGRLRVAALTTMALVGIAASYTIEPGRSTGRPDPATEGSALEPGSSLSGGGPIGGGGGSDAPGDGAHLAQAPGGDAPGSSDGGPLAPSGGQSASASSGGSAKGSSSQSGSSTSSASSSSSASSTSTSSSTSTDGPGSGLLPEGLGEGFGTGGLVNEDQLMQDAQDAASTVTGGLPLP